MIACLESDGLFKALFLLFFAIVQVYYVFRTHVTTKDSMKNRWPIIVTGMALLLIAGSISAYMVINSNDSKSNDNVNQQNSIALDFNKPVCDQVSTSLVESVIGKSIVKTEPINSDTSNVCQYYTDNTHFVTLRLNNLSYENQKTGQAALDRQITTNSQIGAEHFVAMQENGLINDIVIKINDNLILAVDRNSTKAASEDQLINLASQVATFLSSGQSTTPTNDTQVSTQTDEGFIRDFFGLIESKKASEAVMIMTDKNTADDSTKQAWGVQFNDMNSVTVVSIEPSKQSSWTDTRHQYKVVLDMVIDPTYASAPIPYYGYENGQNTRFVTLVKEDGAWKVDELATGP